MVLAIVVDDSGVQSVSALKSLYIQQTSLHWGQIRTWLSVIFLQSQKPYSPPCIQLRKRGKNRLPDSTPQSAEESSLNSLNAELEHTRNECLEQQLQFLLLLSIISAIRIPIFHFPLQCLPSCSCHPISLASQITSMCRCASEGCLFVVFLLYNKISPTVFQIW